jgi:hypothetical protein
MKALPLVRGAFVARHVDILDVGMALPGTGR